MNLFRQFQKGILGNSVAASKSIHGAAEKEPGCM
jgi:hypothetical protein